MRYPIVCRDLYKKYQSKLVGEIDDDRLKFEISTILSREVRFCFVYAYQAYFF